MKFNHLCCFLQEIEKTTLRLEITQILTKLLHQLDKEEVINAFYLLQGKLKPSYDSLEFMMSEKTIIKSLALLKQEFNNSHRSHDLFGQKAIDVTQKEVMGQFKKNGDLSLVGFELLTQLNFSSDSDLTINQVYQKLFAMASFSGLGSQDQKIQALKALLAQLTPLSTKIVLKIILGKLRLGFSTITLIDTLSWTMTGDKRESNLLEQSYQKRADLALLAYDYLFIQDQEKRLSFLNQITTQVLVPITSGLCQRIEGWEEILEKMIPKVIAEPKYDGMRCQIHYKKSANNLEVKVFTRNLENISFMFPELKTSLQKLTNVSEIILDSEVIGFNQSGQFLPFQETMKRKRKHLIEQITKEIPVKFFVFDCLHFNGQSLIDQSLLERKKYLARINLDRDLFKIVEFKILAQADQLKNYHQEQLNLGLEGIIVKKYNSVYPLGRKGFLWVKIKNKEGEISQLNDTLDLVVMGYYVGKGKRTKFGLGAFLVGLLNKKCEVATLSKIGTGLTDRQFQEIFKELQIIKTGDKPKIYLIPKVLKPDFWVVPTLVVEIAADAITKSNLHTSGFGLRFPRLVKIRHDKDLESLTTVEELTTIAKIK